MSPWHALKNEEQDVTSAALRELPPEQELEALRLRVAHLEYRIAEKSIEADALREIGQAIGSMHTIDDILKRVADIVVKVTGTDLCLIYLLNLSGTELVLRGASGSTKDVVGKIRLKMGEGITGWVAQQGQHVVLSSEPWRDERFKPVPNLQQDSYQSMLSVPLRSRKDLVGVINVRTSSTHEYTRMQISLLDSIAHQQCSQDARGDDLDCSLPGCATGIPPGFDKTAQFANIPRGVAILQPKVGQATLSAALCSAIQQVIEVLFAKEQHVLNQGGFFRVSHG